MKKNLKFTLPALLLIAIGAWSFQRNSPQTESIVMKLVYEALMAVHYEPKDFNDELSETVFDDFLENIDGSKRFFQASDIEMLSAYRLTLDDQFKAGKTEFFDSVMSVWSRRMLEAEARYQQILAEPIDLNRVGSLSFDDESRAYTDAAGLDAYWTDLLQYRIVGRLVERENDADSLVQPYFTPGHAKFDSVQMAVQAKELQTNDRWFERLHEMERTDWFGMYMNTFTGVFDPHTNYFPPRQQEDFEIEMRGKLEGIGASLSQDDEYVVVTNIVTGSACWKQGDLEEEDKLLKVAQGDEEPVDVVGMSVSKVVQLVRGEKGTEVRLWVRKKDGSEMVIPIIRDVVELEATFAKSAFLGQDSATGYINLPVFYADYESRPPRDAADDVHEHVERLKAEGMERLILDLRNNGGGSLGAAIDLVGLFIEQGPVLQVQTSSGRVKTYSDDDATLTWDGPLVILVNGNTASASEITAAALQDYQRALVVGTKQTFGKGTVQNMIDLNRAAGPFVRTDEPLGALKMTIQKYYRISGGTTQLQGVMSDIVLPHPSEASPVGERDMDHALKVDLVRTSSWEALDNDFSEVVSASDQRVAEDSSFQRVHDYAQWIKDRADQNDYPISLNSYRVYSDNFDAEAEAFDQVLLASDSLAVRSLASDQAMFDEDEDKVEEYARWYKHLSRDMTIQEAVRIAEDLGDMKE